MKTVLTKEEEASLHSIFQRVYRSGDELMIYDSAFGTMVFWTGYPPRPDDIGNLHAGLAEHLHREKLPEVRRIYLERYEKKKQDFLNENKLRFK